MAHNLDITAGKTSFVSAREDAWHNLGMTLPDTFTAEEAMTHGLLGGWNVRKTPIVAVTEDGQQLAMPGRYAVIRNNPVLPTQLDVLGNVGEAYKVIQNEEHAGLLNALVDESGAHFETAGAIDGGKKVFISMKLPGHINVGGVDRVENYIAAINSHDGSSAFVLMVTPIRIVCQNTMNLAFQNATNMFRVRHTVGASKIMINEARQALDMTFNYLGAFQAEADQLINTEMNQTQFESIIMAAFGAGEDAAPATVTRAENKLEEMFALFGDADTHAKVRNTAWAGLNALTEWNDHFAPTRGDNAEAVRAQKSILDPGFKNRARQLILAGAGL